MSGNGAVGDGQMGQLERVLPGVDLNGLVRNVNGSAGRAVTPTPPAGA